MKGKDKETYRIASNNIGCLGLETIGNHKQYRLKDWIVKAEVDLLGIQEVGLAFHMFQKHERLAERMRDYRRNQIRCVAANNKHESIDKFQWGGTAIVAYDMLANMTRATGIDDTGLGRWSWVQLEGYNNRRVRVVSAYNPCRTRTHQFATVYSQQKRYFLSKGIDICPRMQFRKDLVSILLAWTQRDESVILMIDCNENLTLMKDLQKHLTSAPLSLIDPIRDKYGTTRSLPPTHNTGSYPVDSIFVTQDLQNTVRGGWLKFGEGVGDHRVLYIDINMSTLLGRHKNTTAVKQIRRLQCGDPRTVKSFNDRLEKQYAFHHLPHNIEPFLTCTSVPNNEESFQQLVRIDRNNTQLIKHSEKRCRKLKMGHKPYTPELHKLGLTLHAWHTIIKWKEGKHVHSRYLRRLAE